ncbi:hypothetical protein [Dyadobacter sp. CY312]|uniref:hypothetical protein n=1 Tax=Dyadobacter sp. CY312 TaxID=2907303 RepID=UPI001F2DA993|nr:hypothetical protein [Dyadobacter sp. CY312]MCE7044157.1 hypothetical protein [Dyadobacter sp. CY312]
MAKIEKKREGGVGGGKGLWWKIPVCTLFSGLNGRYVTFPKQFAISTVKTKMDANELYIGMAHFSRQPLNNFFSSFFVKLQTDFC